MYELLLEGPAKNALGSVMMNSILTRLEEAGGRPVLLTGAGDAFSAGLNLKEVMSLDSHGMATFLNTLGRVLESLYHYPGPIVACVNGHAIAGGCLLALACDHRVAQANPKARIGLNEVALGLRFPPSVLDLVRARVPTPLADRVILSAALFDPEQAARMMLVDEVAEDALTVARERLAALASHPAEAYAAAKRDLRGAPSVSTQEQTLQFLSEVLPVWTSDALKDRIRKLLGK